MRVFYSKYDLSMLSEIPVQEDLPEEVKADLVLVFGQLSLLQAVAQRRTHVFLVEVGVFDDLHDFEEFGQGDS